MLDELIGKSWVPIIGKEFEQEYLIKLANWISYIRQSKTIYPESEDVFKALKLCSHGQVKVVVIGQDPYHNGQADGLAFSYRGGQRHNDGRRQSLDIIIEEIERDCYNGFNVGYDYDLSYLAKQGVLLLNSALTVFRGKANSHAGLGWERLTQAILASQIIEKSPKVFLLWGKFAKDVFFNAMNSSKELSNDEIYYYGHHLILDAVHPASDLYNVDSFGKTKPNFPATFAGCSHFSQANKFLLEHQISAIDWFNSYEPYNNIKLSDQSPF